MVVCSECGTKDDFYLEGGYYICNVCQTQSQEMRDLQRHVDDGHASSVYSLRTRALYRKRAKKRKQETTKKSWLTYEGFQCILKEQIKSLIEMGVSPKLEVVVQQFWFQYLRMLGVAFIDKKSGSKLNLSLTRMRDRVIIGEKDSPIEEKKKSDSNISKLDIANWIDTANFSQGDNTLESSEVVDDNDDDDDDDDDGDDDDDDYSNDDDDDDVTMETLSESGVTGSLDAVSMTKGKQKTHGYTAPVTTMTLDMTIGFLYLGILWLGEPILLSDLIRWVTEGHIPFISAWRLLPLHMKLSNCDRHYFCPMTIPTNVKIRYKLGRLAEFMKIKKLPPVDISRIAMRLLLALHLPAELIRYTKNLIEKSDICQEFVIGARNHQKTLDFYEGLAMGFIIVALKMLFGLDDETEHKISKCAKKLQANNGKDLKMFIWDDWVNYIRRQRMDQGNTTEIPRDLSTMYNIKPYLKYQEEVSSKWRGNYSQRTERDKAYKQVTIQKLSEPFQVLQSKVDEDEKTVDAGPSSFYHQNDQSAFTSDRTGASQDASMTELGQGDWLNSSQDTSTPQHEQDSSKVKKTAMDFINSTFEYVVDTRGFVDKHGIVEERDEELLMSSVPDEDPEEGIMEELSEMGLVFLELMRCNAAYKHYITYCDFDMGDTRRVGHFNQEHHEFHHTYGWLLGLCANIFESAKGEIHAQVIKVELMTGITRTKKRRGSIKKVKT